MYDSIIFDLDGTLWDSTNEVAIAFNKVLEEKYPEVTDEVTGDILKGLFGRPLDEIAIKLYRSVSEEHAIKVMEDCCVYECKYLAEHGANLYAGVENILKELHKSYKLFIVSNCQEGYIQCFFQAHPQLEKYFIDYEYPGRTGKSKAENIRRVIERNQLKAPIYVGDTQGDANAAKEAGIPFIYARYGFGKVEEYLRYVDSFSELPDIIK
ncbi:HAD family hydrolase [Mobilitalea sibirica]|uniref:HAD family hydrolase n=2 Tax=Mobilitalea sibirica TaxID=1462919 RepID=A0A8J7H491_9FIRM|nr:HAD family hydrolase [Mobilitalea sibirica]MBH1942193.1 HAD family hydrolase [Mobilitalea sibirica]